MPVFRVRAEEKIVVHERRMLFEFDVTREEQGGYRLHLRFPGRYPDGSFAGSDQVRAADLELNESVCIPFDGSASSLPRGESEITIAGDNGALLEIDVEVPAGWVAIDGEEFYRDDYRG